MSSNQCPVCQDEAMDAMTKLMKRPHVCDKCGVALRMNIVYTAILSILYFALAVRTMIVAGLNGKGMLYVLLLTAVFVVICLFIPLEKKEAQGDT